MHPSRDELQAWLDGELSAARTEQIRGHVDTCAACGDERDALDESTRVTRSLLEALDDPAPDIVVDDVIAVAERRRIDTRSRPRLPWVAVIAGLLSAGLVAAAIVPGSPLRELIVSLGADGQETPASTDAWSQEAGVAMTPGRRLDIVFEARQATGSIDLVATADDIARIEVAGDSVGFAVSDASILIENRDARASFRVVVPDRVPLVSIAIAGRSVYERRDGEVVRDAFEDEGDVERLRFDTR